MYTVNDNDIHCILYSKNPLLRMIHKIIELARDGKPSARHEVLGPPSLPLALMPFSKAGDISSDVVRQWDTVPSAPFGKRGIN